MKKFLEQLNEQAALKARSQTKRDRIRTFQKAFVSHPLLKKYLPTRLSFAISTKQFIQSTAVVAVFLVTGIAVNEPLRNDFLRQLPWSDELDAANADAFDLSQPGEAGIRPVIFSYLGSSQMNVKPSLIEPSIMQLSVPSIAPLANQIHLGKIDPQAQDTRLLDSVINQGKVANLMAEKYKVDVNVLKKYISHAVIVGKEVSIDPVLIIAVMAIESNFNPIVQSPAGAQGLMQVMTSIHANKFTPYGGVQAAFKPEANIRVGAYILKYFIAQAGNLPGGLRFYVGGAHAGDGGYASKVLQERDTLIGFLGGSVPRDNRDLESADVSQAQQSQSQGIFKFLGIHLTDS